MNTKVITLSASDTTTTLHFDPEQASHLSFQIDLRQGIITISTGAQQRHQQSGGQGYQEDQSRNGAEEVVFTQSRIEQRLQRILATILELPVAHVNSSTDFFLAGGDSLVLIDFLLAIEELFGLVLEPELIFDHPRVADLAQVIAEQQPLVQPSPRKVVAP